MSGTENFSEKVKERLAKHRSETVQRQDSLNVEMEKLINSRTTFTSEARRVVTSVILPRIRAVADHFDNADVKDSTDPGLSCACHFAHTARFPATATLTVAIGAGANYETLDLRQTAEILPEFIDYERHCDLQHPLGMSSDEEIGRWVEERIFRFLDTYLQLETHPVYQKDNLVTDPVCGMSLPLAEAAGSTKRNGQEIYFCSLACRDLYLKENQ